MSTFLLLWIGLALMMALALACGWMLVQMIVGAFYLAWHYLRSLHKEKP